MPHEKHDEPVRWKKELDALERLPGEPPTDKNAAWEKLHRRLQDEPYRKKAIGYWVAAAASLLLIVGLSWWTMREKESTLVNDNERQEPPHASVAPVTATGNKDSVVLSPPLLIKKSNAATVETKSKIHYPALRQILLPNERTKISTAVSTLR